MPGDASNISILVTGDVFIFDPDVPFVEATHVPANIDADLVAAWLAAGLMKGDPGVERAREIDRSDIPTWQQGVVGERFKNPKSTLTFNLLEDNEVTDILVTPTMVPRPVKSRIALEFVHDNGHKERWISTAPATIWVPNDNKQEDVNGRDVNVTLTPVNGVLWILQEGVPA